MNLPGAMPCASDLALGGAMQISDGVKFGIGCLLAPFVLGGMMCVGCGVCAGTAAVTSDSPPRTAAATPAPAAPAAPAVQSFVVEPWMSRLSTLLQRPTAERARSREKGDKIDTYRFRFPELTDGASDTSLAVSRTNRAAWQFMIEESKKAPESFAPPGAIRVLSAERPLLKRNPAFAREHPDLDVTTRCLKITGGPFSGTFVHHTRSVSGQVSTVFLQSAEWSDYSDSSPCRSAFLTAR